MLSHPESNPTVPNPWAIILVEGVSDRNAIEALAPRLGRDLTAEGVSVVSMGGAHAISRYIEMYGPHGSNLKLAGLYDLGEEHVVARGIQQGGLGDRSSITRPDFDELGFYVCVTDLEEELIRALGTAGVEELLARQGDLHSFRTLQKQPAWRGNDAASQLRRFMGSGATRKTRYASLIVEALDLADVPTPLLNVLAHVRPSQR